MAVPLNKAPLYITVAAKRGSRLPYGLEAWVGLFQSKGTETVALFFTSNSSTKLPLGVILFPFVFSKMIGKLFLSKPFELPYLLKKIASTDLSLVAAYMLAYVASRAKT